MSEQTIARLGSVIAGELGGYYPRESPYGRWYEEETGAKGFASSAFCAMGLSWAARQAGIPTDVIPTFAWTPSGADFYRRLGAFTKGVAGIRRGDIWFSSCAGIGRISHVGWVESVNADGSFITLEFNTAATINGDQRNGRTVARKRRNSACSLGGYGRPDYPGISTVIRPGTGADFTPTPSEEDDDMPKITDAQLKTLLDAAERINGTQRSRRDPKTNAVWQVLDEGDGGTLRDMIDSVGRRLDEIHGRVNWANRSDGTPFKIAVQGDVDAILRAIAGVQAADVDEAAVARAVVELLPADVTLDPQALADAVLDAAAARLKG